MQLHIANLSLSQEKKTLCRELNLSLNSGDIWGILGANGSGKTTFLHALVGLHFPLQGEIFLGDKNLKTLSRKIIARQIGLLFQDNKPTFPQSVFEYCLAGRHPHANYFSWETADDYAATHAALAEMELTSLSRQNVQTLSGGEQQRLAIATLLAQSPNIYLLDEPVNHLDLRHQIKVLTHFKQLAEKYSKTIMLAIHDINLAQRYCNKILMFLGNGEFLQGNPEEVITADNLQRLYQHSFQAISSQSHPIWIPA